MDHSNLSVVFISGSARLEMVESRDHTPLFLPSLNLHSFKEKEYPMSDVRN
jgi:hypothetical protein